MDTNWWKVAIGAGIAAVSVALAYRFPPTAYGFFVGIVSVSVGFADMREQGGQTNV